MSHITLQFYLYAAYMLGLEPKFNLHGRHFPSVRREMHQSNSFSIPIRYLNLIICQYRYNIRALLCQKFALHLNGASIPKKFIGTVG